jgi:hypothetical protein
MQLIILAYYIPLHNLSKEEANKTLKLTSEEVKNIANDMMENLNYTYYINIVVVPTKQESYVDCIYPKKAEDSDHEQTAIDSLEQIKEKLQNYGT